MPSQEPPTKPVLDSHRPAMSKEHTVQTGESWETIARGLGMDPWDLIDFNFPGMKKTERDNHKLACRHVNWYLSQYIGCTTPQGDNWLFTNPLTGGRGAHRRGVIFLPLSPPPPAPATACAVITLPKLTLPLEAAVALHALDIELPTRARCLDLTAEVAVAKTVYGDSLDYADIYVADSTGMSGRPFTVALPIASPRWIVVLSLGQKAFDHPGSDPSTLIHELAHAWQSQHHREPWRFMVNCVESQLKASLASVVAKANSNSIARPLLTPGLPNYNFGPGSAYAYVPGRPFAEYAGEQIAEQVEDSFSPPTSLSAAARSHIMGIRNHMKSLPAHVPDIMNIQSLRNPNWAHKNFKDVVWHPQ